MKEDLDGILFMALERWQESNRVLLLERGVTATLHGPFEALGMDPVYLLHLDSGSREAEASLFRGGTLLLDSYDKQTAEAETSSIEAASEGDLAVALTSFAERACPR